MVALLSNYKRPSNEGKRWLLVETPESFLFEGGDSGPRRWSEADKLVFLLSLGSSGP